MNVLVDGVFFQLAQTGIGRVWTSMLSRVALIKGVHLIMLNRGDAPAIDGVQRLDFPSFTATYTAADSLLIQQICDALEIDVFTSTYYTSATTTPQVQMVYDMIPEVLGFDMSARAWKEKKIALSYASHFACISSNTRDDLLRFYPHIAPSRIAVTPCGVDRETFNAQAPRRARAFREQYGLSRPYVLLVGSRKQQGNYKNAKLFFDAVSIDRTADFDVLCVGGEPVVDAAWLRGLPTGVSVKRLDLTDAELAAAYSGALALVYPSLYEGFGMPVIEAMASGCPVITTHHGSLGEVAGDAAIIISGHDSRELLLALELVRKPETRRAFVDAGFARAKTFNWDQSAQLFFEQLLLAMSLRYDEQVNEFHRRWKKIRTVQANVDVGLD